MKEYPDKTPSFMHIPRMQKTMHTRNINQRLCNKHVYLFTKQNELFSKKKNLYIWHFQKCIKNLVDAIAFNYITVHITQHITMVSIHKGSMQCQRLVAFWVQLTVSPDVSCNIANILTLHFAINKFKNVESILLYFWEVIRTVYRLLSIYTIFVIKHTNWIFCLWLSKTNLLNAESTVFIFSRENIQKIFHQIEV